MHKKYLGLIIIIIVSILALNGSLVGTSLAQGDDNELSEEQIDRIDQVLDADQIITSYDNYYQVSTELEASEFLIAFPTIDVSIIQERNLNSEGRFINIDEDTVNSHVNITVDYEELSVNGDMSYLMVGEVRSIDDVVYVLAEYEESDGAIEALPDGWVAIEMIEEIPIALVDFGIEDFFGERNDPFTLAQNRQLLLNVVSDVTVESITLEDGTEAEIIDLIIEDAEFQTLVAEFFGSGNDDGESILDAILNSSEIEGTISFQAIFDVDGNARANTIAFEFNVSGIQGVDIDPNTFPEGTEIFVTFVGEQSTIISDINAEDIDEIMVPDIE